MEALPFLFAGAVGFGHAFEADHLVAVSNIVTKRDKLLLALKDGVYWGLGHSSTILAIGFIILVGRATFLEGYFGYFEAGVGLMLVLLGIWRLRAYFRHRHQPEHLHDHSERHHLAYGVGLVHGLAGSGAMVLLVMQEVEGSLGGLLYLLLFGLGSVLGMLVAAGVLGLPFSQKIVRHRSLQAALLLLSSLLCIGYGAFVMWENLA